MSHDAMVNALKQHAAAMDQGAAQPRWAIVSGYDPSTGYIKGEVQPEGVLTGWMPVVYPCVGAGWGIICPPPNGAMVKLIHENGDSENPVVIGCSYNMQDKVPMVLAEFGGQPTNIKQGEIAFVSQTGAVFRMCADNTVYLSGLSLQVDCDVHVNGDIYDKHGSLDRLRQNYDAHEHGGVAEGGATTSTTTKPDAE